jgi:DNA-binding GntR family transcriptional regulator
MNRQLRSAYVYDALRAEIMDGRLPPGSRLASRALAQRFAVSDIPVREALWMLGRDGLIENTPYAGARVRTFSRREILEAYEARGYLESLAVKLGAGKLGEAQKSSVTRIMEELQSSLDRGDLLGYGRLNREFHELILSGCENRRLLSLIESVWDGQVAYQTVFRLNPARARTSQLEHDAIVAAVFAGDGERASELIIEHRQHSATALAMTALSQDDKSDPSASS